MDLRPKRPNLGSERAKLRLEWANFRPKGANSDLRGLTGTMKLMNEQTEEQIKVPMFPSELLLKKTKKTLLMLEGPNLPKSWPHKVILARFLDSVSVLKYPRNCHIRSFWSYLGEVRLVMY